jgi:hypothetical protein
MVKWWGPIVTATWGAEPEGSLESGSLRPALATHRDPISKRQRKNYLCANYNIIFSCYYLNTKNVFLKVII